MSLEEEVRQIIVGEVRDGGQVTTWEQALDPETHFGAPDKEMLGRRLRHAIALGRGNALAIERLARELDGMRG